MNLPFMDKNKAGNKSLGVVNVETEFQATELDGTAYGENAARQKGPQD